MRSAENIAVVRDSLVENTNLSIPLSVAGLGSHIILRRFTLKLVLSANLPYACILCIYTIGSLDNNTRRLSIKIKEIKSYEMIFIASSELVSTKCFEAVSD